MNFDQQYSFLLNAVLFPWFCIHHTKTLKCLHSKVLFCGTKPLNLMPWGLGRPSITVCICLLAFSVITLTVFFNLAKKSCLIMDYSRYQCFLDLNCLSRLWGKLLWVGKNENEMLYCLQFVNRKTGLNSNALKSKLTACWGNLLNRKFLVNRSSSKKHWPNLWTLVKLTFHVLEIYFFSVLLMSKWFLRCFPYFQYSGQKSVTSSGSQQRMSRWCNTTSSHSIPNYIFFCQYILLDSIAPVELISFFYNLVNLLFPMLCLNKRFLQSLEI